MKFCAVAMLLGAHAAEQPGDLKIDWAKLIRFKTDVSLDVSTADGSTTNVLGNIAFNAAERRLSIQAKSRYQNSMLMGPGAPPMSGNEWDEMVIDLSRHKFSIRGGGVAENGVGKSNANYCLSGEVPAFAMVTKAMVHQRIKAYKPIVESELQMMPHTLEDGVATYNGGGTKVQIMQDGTPVQIEGVDRTPNGPVTFDAKFSNWQQGTPGIHAFECPTGSSTELSEKAPSIMLHQVLMEHLGQTQFADMVEIPEPMQLVAEINRQQKEKSLQQQPQLAASVAAGVVGGMVVVALAKVYNGKPVRGEPLLSHA